MSSTYLLCITIYFIGIQNPDILRHMKVKIKTWLKRYLPGEIFGMIGSLTGGLVVGKLTADITFYIPTIIAFELRNKFLSK